MDRKRPITAVEILAGRLRERGYKVKDIRQPVPAQPGFVSFSSEKSPKNTLVIKVLETFLGLQDDLIEMIAKAEREMREETWQKIPRPDPED